MIVIRAIKKLPSISYTPCHPAAIKVLAPFAAFESTRIVIQIEGARLVRALKRSGVSGVRQAYLLARWSVYEFPF